MAVVVVVVEVDLLQPWLHYWQVPCAQRIWMGGTVVDVVVEFVVLVEVVVVMVPRVRAKLVRFGKIKVWSVPKHEQARESCFLSQPLL